MMPEVLYQFEKFFYLLCWLERRTLLTWLLIVLLFMIKNAYKVAFFKNLFPIAGVRTENRIWVFMWYTLFFGFQYPPVLAYTYKAIVLFQQPSGNLLPVFCCWLFYSLINTFWPSINDWLPEYWKALLLIVIVKYSGLNACLSICHILDSSTDTDKYPYSQGSCLSLLFKLV